MSKTFARHTILVMYTMRANVGGSESQLKWSSFNQKTHKRYPNEIRRISFQCVIQSEQQPMSWLSRPFVAWLQSCCNIGWRHARTTRPHGSSAGSECISCGVRVACGCERREKVPLCTIKRSSSICKQAHTTSPSTQPLDSMLQIGTLRTCV